MIHLTILLGSLFIFTLFLLVKIQPPKHKPIKIDQDKIAKLNAYMNAIMGNIPFNFSDAMFYGSNLYDWKTSKPGKSMGYSRKEFDKQYKCDFSNGTDETVCSEISIKNGKYKIKKIYQ